jgi:hypothetical protein
LDDPKIQEFLLRLTNCGSSCFKILYPLFFGERRGQFEFSSNDSTNLRLWYLEKYFYPDSVPRFEFEGDLLHLKDYLDILLKNYINPTSLSLRLLYSTSACGSNRHVHYAVFKTLMKTVGLDKIYKDFGLAIYSGRNKEVERLLLKIDDPSILSNLFFAAAVFRNNLEAAKLILKHPKI